jgi:hypothetical protein
MAAVEAEGLVRDYHKIQNATHSEVGQLNVNETDLILN